MTQSLDPFFAPRSVAVVGASTRESSVGHALLKNLLQGGQPARWAPGPNGSLGFGGKIYAVNRKGGEILGVQANTSLTEIGEAVDLVVIAIPPRFIKGVIEECGSIGTKTVIVISARRARSSRTSSRPRPRNTGSGSLAPTAWA